MNYVMTILHQFILLILAAIDSFVLINTVYNHYYSLNQLIEIHLLIVLCSYFITSSFEKKKYFINSLCLFLPGLGLIIGFCIKIFENYKGTGDMMDEYEDHISYIDNLGILKDINIVDEINTMSVSDKLRYSNSSKKKDAVINFDTDDIPAKVKILKQALHDSDPEVVHYAAAMLNTLDSDFNKKIRKYSKKSKKYNPIDQLNKKATIMMDYIDSGLLDVDVKNCYLTKYLNIIEDLEDVGIISYHLELNKGIAARKLCQFDLAHEVFNTLISSYPDRYEAYTELMGLLYKQNLPAEVKKIVAKISSSGIDIPEEHLEIYKYWGMDQS